MFRNHLASPMRPAGALALAVAFIATIGLAGAPAHAAEAPVDLGSAGSFAVLAGQSVTNTGPSVVTGDVGISPGSSISGMPPLVILDGTLHAGDAVAAQAQSELTTAYNSAAGRSTVTDVTGQDLGGMRLTSGVVEHTSSMHLTGTVTLDAQGDPAAVFIFKAGSSLITAPNSTVSLVNGASPCNVFWQVGSSATLDTNTTFVGTIMALTSATLGTATTVRGRVLARNGSVTLDTNVITRPGCPSPAPPSAAPSTPAATAAPSSAPSPGASSSSTPGNTAVSSGTGGGNGGGGTSGTRGTSGDGNGGGSTGDDTGGPGDGATPVVPVGHPETGLGSDSVSVGDWWMLLSLLGGTAVVGAALSRQRTRPVRRH